MTIEELKDEFARYLYIDSVDYYSKEPLTERKLLQIWLDCAEPREKKIQNLEKENEQLKENIKNARKKLFDILTDYEIGNYDNNIHQFYKDVYDIHNELMDLEK